MSHIIMDLSGNSVSLAQCSSINLVILFFQKCLVFFRKKKRMFLTVIPDLMKILVKSLIFSGIEPERKLENETKNPKQTKNCRKSIDLKNQKSPKWKLSHCQRKKPGR